MQKATCVRMEPGSFFCIVCTNACSVNDAPQSSKTTPFGECELRPIHTIHKEMNSNSLTNSARIANLRELASLGL